MNANRVQPGRRTGRNNNPNHDPDRDNDVVQAFLGAIREPDHWTSVERNPMQIDVTDGAAVAAALEHTPDLTEGDVWYLAMLAAVQDNRGGAEFVCYRNPRAGVRLRFSDDGTTIYMVDILPRRFDYRFGR